MGIIENIQLAINSLFSNKMRSILTMLGIIIGIGSVIAIVTVGDSLASSITSEMSGVGARNINIGLEQKNMGEINEDGTYNESEDGIYNPYEIQEKDYITDEMLKDYKAIFKDDIRAISVVEDVGTNKLANGKNKAEISIKGINSEYSSVEKINMLQGRFINGGDVESSRNVAVVSDKFINKYFGESLTYEEALGKSFEITLEDKVVQIYICGVYEYVKNDGEISFSNNGEESTNVYIPISSAKKLLKKQSGYMGATILPSTEADVDNLLFNTIQYFESVYNRNPDVTVMAYNMESMMKSVNKMISNVKLAISGVAAISLLVGGIGVMNIMMVSITERTKEIGIRKALGAKGKIILFQFIVEAVIICLIGGIIGIITGVGLGAAVTNILGKVVKPNIQAMFYAVTFSMAIGVFFGYYPASKAAKMNPIDALRYE